MVVVFLLAAVVVAMSMSIMAYLALGSLLLAFAVYAATGTIALLSCLVLRGISTRREGMDFTDSDELCVE